MTGSNYFLLKKSSSLLIISPAPLINWSGKVEYVPLENYKLILIPAEASLDVNKCLERLWVGVWYCSHHLEPNKSAKACIICYVESKRIKIG